MRARNSALSVPVSMIYAAAAVSTGQPIIIALGVIMVVVAAGYLVSELQPRNIVQGQLRPSPAKVDDRPSGPDNRQLESSQPSMGERVLPAVFIAATLVLTILLAVNAAVPLGG